LELPADTHGTSHAASWQDNFAINLEIETIGRHIRAGHSVLDVGCANGYSAIRQLARNPASITGIDFSEPMIREAQKNKSESAAADKLTFRVGDVRKLPLEDGQFDVVYTTRTLINLPTWQEQQQGILECLRVCKRGGTVILSEAFWEPLTLLNSLRALKALPPLMEHDFNRYLKKSYLEDFLAKHKLPFECEEFSSIYYLGSRFLRELVTNPADYPGYSNPINEVFFNIEKQFSGGGFGIQQAYVLRKN
jgi:ubiquinone/menaquinone biosynthesis C-methylase UbiE